MLSSLPVSILLVDDEPRNLLALEAALISVECKLVFAQSGDEALWHVLEQDFAAIVLDIHMAGMDGFETAGLIREHPSSSTTPIIFLTADDRAGARVREGYRLGAVDYLYKPFDAEVLRAKVSVFVELFRKNGELQQLTAELSATAASLERSEEHFRALIENAPDLTLVLGADGVVRYVSPAVERILGYPPELITGRSMTEFLHPDDTASAQSDVARLLRTDVVSLPTRRRCRHADGSYRILESTSTNQLANPSVAGLVVHLRDVTERTYAEERLRALSAELERTRAEAELRHQALHDGLTGLPNRVLLYERLEHAFADPGRGEAPFALLSLGLDRFKEVNDTLGYQVGDTLLHQFGQRLQAAVLPGDLVARLGSDEFAILLSQSGEVRAAQVAEDLVRALKMPFTLDSQSIIVDASVGIAVAPQHGQDADTLLRRLDAAMHQAKRSRMGVVMYSPELDLHQPDRLTLLDELRVAIEGNELLLHFQPELDMRDGTLAGVEALVRWQHPQRGFLSPGDFIPLAEASGLIHALSLWVLEAVLRQQQAWRARGVDMLVAVNLSRRTLHDPRLFETVADLLTRYDVLPSALMLELTEGSLMSDPVRAAANLEQFRSLGVRVSIDDFGMGYSSLASLKNLPVDELKIDASFVRAMAEDASSRAIVRAIIDLADALNLRVVAEGIEDRATWNLLVGLGCDIAQGYFISPPLAADELETWLSETDQSWRELAARPEAADPLRDRIRGRGARLTAEEEFLARKRVEAALLASEERNRLALQAAHMGTWDWDVARDVLTWSSETEALSGVEPGSFGGTFAAYRETIHPQDWPAMEVEFAAAVAEHREFLSTYRPLWPDGSVHWLEGVGRGLYDADGRMVRMTGTLMDITERKQAEVALQASEERNRLALQAAHMGTWSFDAVNSVHSWSPVTEALHGLAPGTFEGTFAAFERAIDPSDWPAFEIEMKAATVEGRESSFHYRTIWPDGSQHHIESTSRAQYAADGSLRRVTGTSVDITERTIAEEALQASEERFRKQYKGFPLPTLSWLRVGDDFVLQDFNDVAETLSEGHVVGDVGNRASAMYADKPDILADFRACTAEQRTIRREMHHWFRHTDRDRDIVVTYVFVPPQTVMVHTEDITDARQAAQQRDAMAQSEKLRALGQMASGIAHDLNQSLMLVSSYSGLARQALVLVPPDLAEADELMTTATQAAMDGGETVKRLLTFTRAAPEHESQVIDLTSVVRDAARLTAPRWRDAAQAEGRPISLHVETDGLPTVLGSPGQLRELMTNVIFNAVDALPTGGTIHLRVAAEDGQGIIEICDSGAGMSVEVQERVFEPFFTTKGERGTGLGLAMVFGIVEQHGGQIDVRSSPGAGTTFRIRLPLVSAPAESEPAAQQTSVLDPLRLLRVLIVDDEPMMTKAVVRMLRPTGHLVSVAGSGEEALQKLAEEAFDVVVSDMSMGAGMNGWELADAVTHRWPGVRFMLATGWGAAIDPNEARAKGVEAVLSKPYQSVDLIRALA